MTGTQALNFAIGFVNSRVGNLGKVVEWLGVTTTEITDGSTTNPVVINGESVKATSGDFVQYGSTVFSFSKDGVWQESSLKVELVDSCLYFN